MEDRVETDSEGAGTAALDDVVMTRFSDAKNQMRSGINV
jgi:hypothetical protein